MIVLVKFESLPGQLKQVQMLKAEAKAKELQEVAFELTLKPDAVKDHKATSAPKNQRVTKLFSH